MTENLAADRRSAAMMAQKTTAGQFTTNPNLFRDLRKGFDSRLFCSNWLCIYLLITVHLSCFTHAAGLKPISCYSCMSTTYKTHWRHFKNMYFAPEVFTEDCNEPFDKRSIPEILCHSVCLVIANPVYIAGRYIGNDMIRGCFNRIMRRGWNNSTMIQFEQYDICRSIKNSQMLYDRRHLSTPDDDSTARVCSCYQDRCNDGSLINSAYSRLGSCGTVLIFLLVLFTCTPPN